MQNIDQGSLGIVLSGGGTRSAYATGALRALAEVHGVTAPKVLVANSGGAAPGMFYLARRFDEMYEWATLFDDPRFISWWRLCHGPVMDIDFLVDDILARQVPNLQKEIHTGTRYYIAATHFPSQSSRWFSRDTGEPLFEQMRATATASGVSGPVVRINGDWFADGHFSISIHDCVAKATQEGAQKILLIDNAIYGKASRLTQAILKWGVRKAHESVRFAVQEYCKQERRPITRADIIVCRRDVLTSRHPLTRSAHRLRATIDEGYTDMANLRLS